MSNYFIDLTTARAMIVTVNEAGETISESRLRLPKVPIPPPELIDLTHLSDDEEEEAASVISEFTIASENEELSVVSAGSFEVPDHFIEYRQPTLRDIVMEMLDDVSLVSEITSATDSDEESEDEEEEDEDQMDLEDADHPDDERMAHYLFEAAHERHDARLTDTEDSGIVSLGSQDTEDTMMPDDFEFDAVHEI